jgi:hypothetical protein
MNDVTRIFSAIEKGDPTAAEQLMPPVRAGPPAAYVHPLAFCSAGLRCLSNQPMMWRIFDI